MKSRANFVDYVKLSAKAGDGGHGCVSFLSLKGQPFAGPDGGDGGRGGSIFLQAKREIMTLGDVKAKSHVVAKRGANGGSKNCSGRSGSDITIYIPVGTHIVDSKTEEELGDLTKDGQRLRIVRGGDGGNGNQHYASSKNKAPRKAQDGWPGDERTVILELKIIADIGFVGLPNAGKSTLLSALTKADPDIAPYPFTTLSPNLGVMLSLDFTQNITLADIPGLIEGAHTGAGLGHRFLRHIERTRALVHVVGPESGDDSEGNPILHDASPESVFYSYELVRSELESYSDKLTQKPFVIALNKTDLMTEEDVVSIQQYFVEKTGERPVPISAQDNNGTELLQQQMELLLDKVTE